MSQPGRRGAAYVGYQLRPVVVAPDLDALHGPTHGSHQLPGSWTARPGEHRLRRPADRKAAHQLVLLEGADVTDHEQWLQRTPLLELWSELYLSRGVRAAWQSAHARTPTWPGSAPDRTSSSRSAVPTAMTTGAYNVRGIQSPCAPRTLPTTAPDISSQDHPGARTPFPFE